MLFLSLLAAARVTGEARSMYLETTHEIEVKVLPFYLNDQSDPDNDSYVWGYQVTITNHSNVAARLLSRHWIITDGKSRVEEVKGEGVVGQTPLIKPGESFEYTSACPLTTPTGNMRGSYHLVDADGRRLSIKIPLFFLRRPETFH